MILSIKKSDVTSMLSLQVWFQNRRTKWRKKHAAEMATAKKKQDDVRSNVCSDVDDDLDLGDNCSPLTDGNLDFSSLKSV